MNVYFFIQETKQHHWIISCHELRCKQISAIYLWHSSATFSILIEGAQWSPASIPPPHAVPSPPLLFLPSSSSHRFIAERRSRVFRWDKRRPSRIKALSPDSVERPAMRFFRKAFDMVHALWHCRIWACGGIESPQCKSATPKGKGPLRVPSVSSAL